MKRDLRIWCVVVLALGVSATRGTEPAFAVQQAEPVGAASRPSSVPSDLAWTRIRPSEKSRVLELLKNQTKGNFEKIRTWKATYSGRLKQFVAGESAVSAFAKLSKEDTQALLTEGLLEEFVLDFRFAIDLPGDRIFREQHTSKMRLLTAKSLRQLTIPGTSPLDLNSIITPDYYIYLPPKEVVLRWSVLPDHPKARNKRAARREPAESGRKRNGKFHIDPRRFFGLSSARGMSWEELDAYLSWLNGKKGEDARKVAERMEIDQADHSGQTWYRIRLPVTGPPGPVTATSVWSPAAGFNPVSMAISRDNAPDQPIKIRKWDWKAIDGIFVPSFVQDEDRLAEGQSVNFSVELNLGDCTLNQPLDAKQFDYQALGLKDGELVLDYAQKVVFMLEDGTPVKLAAFNEAYIPPPATKTLDRSRWPFVVGAALFVIIITLTLLLRRRSRTTT